MCQVTITGGGGNLGREVALILAARGYRVIVFDLPEADCRFATDRAEIQVVRGDVRNQQSLRDACRHAELVVHLAAILPPLSETNHDWAWAVNVEGSRTLLEVMPVEASLVFASSVATYGMAQSEVVGIEHPQYPIDFYGKTKLQNEHDILASGRSSAILRISGISVPALLEIPRPWFFTRDQKVEFVHLQDAALAVAKCVGNVHALGHVWQIAGGPSWRMTGQDYSNAICRAFHVPLESAIFLNKPNWPAWYDTKESQAFLNYQRHTFDDFVSQLHAIYQEAVGIR